LLFEDLVAPQASRSSITVLRSGDLDEAIEQAHPFLHLVRDVRQLLEHTDEIALDFHASPRLP
jgi:hypothetical protein